MEVGGGIILILRSSTWYLRADMVPNAFFSRACGENLTSGLGGTPWLLAGRRKAFYQLSVQMVHSFMNEMTVK